MMFDLENYEDQYPNFNYIYNSITLNGDVDKIYKWIENITHESDKPNIKQKDAKKAPGECFCIPFLKCFKIKSS